MKTADCIRTVLVSFVVSFAFAGCSDDDDNQPRFDFQDKEFLEFQPSGSFTIPFHLSGSESLEESAFSLLPVKITSESGGDMETKQIPEIKLNGLVQDRDGAHLVAEYDLHDNFSADCRLELSYSGVRIADLHVELNRAHQFEPVFFDTEKDPNTMKLKFPVAEFADKYGITWQKDDHLSSITWVSEDRGTMYVMEEAKNTEKAHFSVIGTETDPISHKMTSLTVMLLENFKYDTSYSAIFKRKCTINDTEESYVWMEFPFIFRKK